jgi:hypothetical protein
MMKEIKSLRVGLRREEDHKCMKMYLGPQLSNRYPEDTFQTMHPKSFHGLDQGINEDLFLTQVTINDSTSSSCCPITTTASDYDPSLSQTSFQPQAFNISQFALPSLQPPARSQPSTVPRPVTDSAYSCSLITQDGDLTTAAFDYDQILFQTCSQPQAFNLSQFALPSLQPLARSWPFTDSPTMSNGNIDYPLSPPNLIPSSTKRPSSSTSVRSTATSSAPSPSKPTSPRTTHSKGPPARSESRKSRRRAQNCAAQRAFRARKEDTIKESSVRLEILQAKLERLEGDNGSLNNTVDGLRGEIDGLRRDCCALRRASVEGHR